MIAMVTKIMSMMQPGIVHCHTNLKGIAIKSWKIPALNCINLHETCKGMFTPNDAVGGLLNAILVL